MSAFDVAATFSGPIRTKQSKEPSEAMAPLSRVGKPFLGSLAAAERPAELRKHKKDIARLLTVLHERELAEKKGAPAKVVEERSKKS